MRLVKGANQSRPTKNYSTPPSPSHPLMQPDFNERAPIHAYTCSYLVYISHEGFGNVQGIVDFPAG